MRNPWDAFPFPLKGDQDPEKTYAGVGHVMSEWESVEFNLARVYGVFVGGDAGGKALQEYGAPRIFASRLKALEQAAEAFFFRRCDQNIEGEFHLLTLRASGFSARRNDVAHGIVMNVSNITFFKEKLHLAVSGEKQHLLVPTYYAKREHDGHGRPNYAFNAGQLRELASRLIDLGKDIVSFRSRL